MKKLFIIPIVAAVITILFAFGGDKNCPSEGKPNPKKGNKAVLKPREKNLNRHKNRETAPQAADIDNGVTLQGMYDSKDDSIFNADKGASMVGYIFRALDAGMESCNCYTEDKSKYSINVYISKDPITKQTRDADCIVAVITPYSKTLNTNWTADYITDKFVGKRVKLTGWLIYDYLMGNESVETNSNGTHLDRRTVWGVCPVTDIKSLE